MSTYDPDSDQLHEECGVFGVWAPDRDVARLTYFGLRALQHRGQESAGIAVGDGGTVMVRKDLGLLDRVFSNADLSTLSGQLAVGHVRYGTAGAKSWEACAAAPLYHQQRHYRACAQRHPRQHRRAAPPADRAGRAVPLQFGFRGRDQAHRLLYPAHRPSARGHSQDHGARARRLRHDAHQRAAPSTPSATRMASVRSCWASS